MSIFMLVHTRTALLFYGSGLAGSTAVETPCREIAAVLSRAAGRALQRPYGRATAPQPRIRGGHG